MHDIDDRDGDVHSDSEHDGASHLVLSCLVHEGTTLFFEGVARQKTFGLLLVPHVRWNCKLHSPG